MAFPVLPVVLPSSLSGAVNGRLSAGVLEVLGCPGRKGARAHPLAAAAFRSLSAAVLGVSGEVLTVTSNADAYRSYEVQELTFRARYTLEVMLRPSKIWDGRRWFQRPGVAMSAVPGTSNHGWGLAFDVCGWSGDETVYIESLKAWPWIRANAGRFGLSWEAQSEPWHLRYVAGDRVPDAVDQPEVPGGPAGVDASSDTDRHFDLPEIPLVCRPHQRTHTRHADLPHMRRNLTRSPLDSRRPQNHVRDLRRQLLEPP